MSRAPPAVPPGRSPRAERAVRSGRRTGARLHSPGPAASSSFQRAAVGAAFLPAFPPLDVPTATSGWPASIGKRAPASGSPCIGPRCTRTDREALSAERPGGSTTAVPPTPPAPNTGRAGVQPTGGESLFNKPRLHSLAHKLKRRPMVLAEQASEDAGRTRLVLVLSEHLASLREDDRFQRQGAVRCSRRAR